MTIIPDRRAYSDRTALLTAKLANAAYIDFAEADTLKTEIAKHGFSLIDTVSAERPLRLLKNLSKIDTQAMLVKHDVNNAYFIVFRGSEPDDLTDWYTDAKVRLEDVEPGITLHNGFLEAYRIVEDVIRKWIASAESAPLYLCGHSLGGALSIVTAALNREQSFASCYTFGGPRVGEIKVDLVKTPIYRVANYHDPVPDIPPASFLISEYRHIGDEYRLREGAQAPEIIAEDSVINNLLDFAKEAGLAFRTLASDGVSSAIKGVAKTKIEAHSMQLYLDRLEAIAKARN